MSNVFVAIAVAVLMPGPLAFAIMVRKAMDQEWRERCPRFQRAMNVAPSSYAVFSSITLGDPTYSESDAELEHDTPLTTPELEGLVERGLLALDDWSGPGPTWNV
jgi:hypothetical protein